MPSPIRGCRNTSTSYERDVMVNHVHRARLPFADLVSSLVFYLLMGPLAGPGGRTTCRRSAYNTTLAQEQASA